MQGAAPPGEDEVDMTVEELRCWVQKEVECNKLLNWKKVQLDQMKMLIERKEEQTANTKVLLNRTFELMSGCEASLKELYREIDMVYKDTDSEDEGEIEPTIIEIDDEDDAADEDEEDDVMAVEAPQTVNVCEDDTKCEGESSVSLPSDLHSVPPDPPSLPSVTPPIENGVDQPPPASIAASSPPRGISPVSGTDSSPNSLSQRLSIPKETQTQVQSDEPCTRQFAARFQMSTNGRKVVVLSNLPGSRQHDSETGTGAQSEEEKQEEEIMEVEIQEEDIKEDEIREVKIQEEEIKEDEIQEVKIQEEEEEEIQEAAEDSSDGSDASWEPPGGAQRGSSNRSSEESDAESTPSTKRLCGRGAGAKPRGRGRPPLTMLHKGTETTKQVKGEPNRGRTPSRSNTSSPASSQPPQKKHTGKSSAAVTPPRPPQEAVQVGMEVWARISTDTWKQTKILEIKTEDTDSRGLYKVGLKGDFLWLPGHHIAFDHTPSLDRLYVGVRLLAKCQENNQFSSGTLGELPLVKNRMRFLVFLDNGTPCYVGLPWLRLICRPSENISEEEIKDAAYRDFLLDYVKQYPFTPMAQYRLGQHINTEHNGIQKRCQVEAVDSSLIHILFQDDQHKEWLYRGSTRLQHLAHMKKQATDENKETDSALPQQKTASASLKARKHHRSSSVSSSSSSQTSSKPAKPSSNLISTVVPPRASLAPYTVHRCCPACLGPRGEHRGCNPLFFPLLCGFSRIKARLPDLGCSEKFFHIFYRSPCGVSLASMDVIEDYLQQTRCDYLSISMFCLDLEVSVTTTFQAMKSQIFIPDLSQGTELQPLSCINEMHASRPRGLFSYIKQQAGGDTVSINTSLDFLVGCDCTDGCKDRTSCSCHQLTVQATALESGGPVDVNAGYSHMRLERQLLTGVYECNSLCRCDPRFCSNRVVQHGVRVRLQVFMTQKRGWGVRCLDDVAMGSFICSYAGKVLTSEEIKTNMADYFCARLNLIETGEAQRKEGYESEAHCSEDETAGSDSKQVKEGDDPDMSDCDTNSGSDVEYWSRVAALTKCYRTRNNNKHSQEGSDKESKSHDQSPGQEESQEENSQEGPSVTTRRFFEDQKTTYFVSSKAAGNVARFINHSCSPNLMSQNVFVDNHDLRFPWITFFARKRIAAGTELTWDYRSLIGPQNKRMMKCNCNSRNCKGKI